MPIVKLLSSENQLSNGAVATVKTRANENAKNTRKVVTLTRKQGRIKVRTFVKGPAHIKSPPAARLVCVESNPGPKVRPRQGFMQPRNQRRMAEPPRPSKQGRKRRAKQVGALGPMLLGANSNRFTGMPGQKIAQVGMATSSNAAMTRKPQVIENDEYIADVNGSVNFATTAFSVNPGLQTTFPFGSKIAQLYDEYEFEALEFYVTSEVSGYATQGQTGVVVLSFDYDAADAAPNTKQEVEDTEPHTVPCLPSTSVIRLTVDPQIMRKNDAKYVRIGSVASTDIKTYDVGNLYVSTQGQANTTAFGELHVYYRLRLKRPILGPATVVGGAMHWSTIAATTANNLAAFTLQSGGSSNLSGITLSAGGTLTFPAGIPGNYFISLALMGATSIGAISSFVSATALNILTQSATRDSVAANVSLAGTTTSFAMLNQTITVPTGGVALTLNANATITGTGSGDLFIFALPSSVITARNPLRSEIEELRDQVCELKNFVRSQHRVPRLLSESIDSDFEEEKADSSVGSSGTSLSRSTVNLLADTLSKALSESNKLPK